MGTGGVVINDMSNNSTTNVQVIPIHTIIWIYQQTIVILFQKLLTMLLSHQCLDKFFFSPYIKLYTSITTPFSSRSKLISIH